VHLYHENPFVFSYIEIIKIKYKRRKRKDVVRLKYQMKIPKSIKEQKLKIVKMTEVGTTEHLVL
jgi:hypothetical protein